MEGVGRVAPKGLGIHAKYPAYRNFFPQAYALFGLQENKDPIKDCGVTGWLNREWRQKKQRKELWMVLGFVCVKNGVSECVVYIYYEKSGQQDFYFQTDGLFTAVYELISPHPFSNL